MGAFVANFHVRGADVEAARQTLRDIGASEVRVESPCNGWVSVYERRASDQDETWIAHLAGDLSGRLRTVCVAFLVHDSDIARYWLMDQGELLDEYNSAPDYFCEVSPAEKRRLQGRANVFLRYCRPGVTAAEIEAVLRADETFAEDIITKLAELLGIDPGNALGDYGHTPFSGDADGSRGFGDMAGIVQTMQEHFAGMFGASAEQATSPESNALVEAAAAGNVAEIDRLVGIGTDVNAPGLLPLQTGGAINLFGNMAMAPKVALSPLLAAASRAQAAAVQRLLDQGANAMEDHPLYGSALHGAAQSGSPDTVRVLLAAGIPADLKNRQGYTPRNLIETVRKQIEMTKNLAKSMPHLQMVFDQLSAKLADLPEAGWDACEEILRDAGG